MTLEKLSSEDKKILDLYFKGYNKSEIGRIVGRSRKTVRKKINKAIELGILPTQDSIEKSLDVEKQKLRLQGERKALQELLTKQSRLELIVEAIKEAVEPIPYMPYKIRRKYNEEEELCLVISDVHIGKITKTYNIDVFKKRLTILWEVLLSIKDILKIDTLNILFAGDIVDGEGIYPTQSFHIDRGAVRQIFEVGVPEITNSLIMLAKEFSQIHVFCVPGNHGSMKYKDEASNWDIIFYESCRIATQNYSNIRWHISYDWNIRYNIFNWKFEMIHGHQIKQYLHVPHYGITMKGSRWHGTHGGFNYLVMGHFHSFSMVRHSTWEYIINGSFSSSDDYADEKLGLSSSPEQLLFGISKKSGITWRYLIQLKKI